LSGCPSGSASAGVACSHALQIQHPASIPLAALSSLSATLSAGVSFLTITWCPPPQLFPHCTAMALSAAALLQGGLAGVVLAKVLVLQQTVLLLLPSVVARTHGYDYRQCNRRNVSALVNWQGLLAVLADVVCSAVQRLFCCYSLCTLIPSHRPSHTDPLTLTLSRSHSHTFIPSLTHTLCSCRYHISPWLHCSPGTAPSVIVLPMD